jgi:3-methyladenine DNA glycosylase AlkC
MAEPLKNQFGTEVPRAIATMIAAVHPAFAVKTFMKDVLQGYDDLALMARGEKIARALHQHLPADFAEATQILLDSLDKPHDRDTDGSLSSFLYLPHTLFVARHGLDHFEMAMRAQHTLTQRFTAEFSIRPFLEHHAEATLQQLKLWAKDPSAHVRRLVSEGSRPRLPWAPRLRAFQKNPTPVLALLDLLKDDPDLYVRRSVANNLNDIGKDHPDRLVETARAWLKDASEDRLWIIRHALRFAVKQGNPAALAVLGFESFEGVAPVSVHRASLTPTTAVMGRSVTIAFDVRNDSDRAQRVLVDFCIHYIKANGSSSAKVFKLKTLALEAGESARISKKVSLAEMTTRKHYPGTHRVDALINGQAAPLGAFELATA